MRALHWDGEEVRRVDDYPEPKVGAGEALLRVRLAGICSTDQQIFKGYMGFTGVPGHEFVGEVLEGPPEWRGKRVVAEINFACGACDACAAGMGRHCPTRRVLGILNADGAFAERVAVPVACLHEVPEGVSDEAAVFTEPLAAAFEILEQVPVTGDTRALVLGDGKLGLLCAWVLGQAGADTTLVGKHPGKLERVAGAGVRTVLLDEFQPQAYDVVVEATGSERGLASAMECVRPRGTLVLKSTVAAQHRLSLAPLVIHEVSVVGSRCGPFGPALEALAKGAPVQALIDGRYSLDDGLEAIDRASTRDVLKVLLEP